MLKQENMIAFYVADVKASVEFYKTLLDSAPLEQSDDFAMFVFPSGLLLGLWLDRTVEPKIVKAGTEGEIIFSYEHDSDIDEAYQALKQKGIKIEQPPVMLEFGYNFLIVDPDNHRIRYFRDSCTSNG